MEETHPSMPTSLPILLAHGICPFTRLLHPLAGRDNVPNDRLHYFRRIRSTLQQNGYTAFHTRVSWAGSADRRARDLRDEVVRLTGGFRRWPRVHLIAHSMGGLDARRMLWAYRMEDRVASLTTIGTPHLGTSYADRGGSRGRADLLIAAARPFGLRLEGLRDLTREQCRRFNRMTAAYEARNGVPVRTVAGVQPLERIFFPMRFASRIIQREEGENDGLVPRTSALWRPEHHLTTIDADHLNQIGWWDLGERKAGRTRRAFEAWIRGFYLELASGLEE